MARELSYVEIGVRDVDQARGFFEALFGWSFHPMGKGGEGWFETPTLRAGMHGDEPQPRFYVFFSVPDLEAAVARVRELGGEADEPGPEEPGFGRFANCRDPQGLEFGLHQRPSRG